MSGLLSGKTAVITGGSRGLGLAMAEAFGAEGAAVVVGSRNPEAVAEAVRRLEDRGARSTGLACDVTSPGQIAGLAELAHRTFGGFDIWVNNAGISAPYGPTAEVDPSSFEKVVATNILGVYHGSMTALGEFLPKRSGKLINLLGRGDRQPAPYQSAYGSSKTWVRSFTLALAREYRDSGVSIFAFNPGLVLTDLLLHPDVIAGREQDLQGVYGFIVNAWGSRPEAPARKAAWLAGPATDGQTGRVVSLVGFGTILARTFRWILRRLAGRAPSATIRARVVPPYFKTPSAESVTS